VTLPINAHLLTILYSIFSWDFTEVRYFENLSEKRLRLGDNLLDKKNKESHKELPIIGCIYLITVCKHAGFQCFRDFFCKDSVKILT